MAMLLYDRVMEQAHDYFKRVVGSKTLAEAKCLADVASLHNIPVYEISKVVPICEDWSIERTTPNSKKPPCNNLWAEWAYQEKNPSGSIVEDWTIANNVCGMEPTIVTEILAAVKEGLPKNTIDLFLEPSNGYYCVRIFKCLHRTTQILPARHPLRTNLGRPICNPGVWLIRLFNDWSESKFLTLLPQTPEQAREASCFGMDVMLSMPATDPYYQPAFPWPPFYAFSLLNSGKATEEKIEPDPHVQERLKKQRKPLRTEYIALQP